MNDDDAALDHAADSTRRALLAALACAAALAVPAAAKGKKPKPPSIAVMATVTGVATLDTQFSID